MALMWNSLIRGIGYSLHKTLNNTFAIYIGLYVVCNFWQKKREILELKVIVWEVSNFKYGVRAERQFKLSLCTQSAFAFNESF